jgi:hypothetical protein
MLVRDCQLKSDTFSTIILISGSAFQRSTTFFKLPSHSCNAFSLSARVWPDLTLLLMSCQDNWLFCCNWVWKAVSFFHKSITWFVTVNQSWELLLALTWLTRLLVCCSLSFCWVVKVAVAAQILMIFCRAVPQAGTVLVWIALARFWPELTLALTLVQSILYLSLRTWRSSLSFSQMLKILSLAWIHWSVLLSAIALAIISPDWATAFTCVQDRPIADSNFCWNVVSKVLIVFSILVWILPWELLVFKVPWAVKTPSS